jgi:hypothetical protein
MTTSRLMAQSVCFVLFFFFFHIPFFFASPHVLGSTDPWNLFNAVALKDSGDRTQQIFSPSLKKIATSKSLAYASLSFMKNESKKNK